MPAITAALAAASKILARRGMRDSCVVTPNDRQTRDTGED
jgi:hypothetical protein